MMRLPSQRVWCRWLFVLGSLVPTALIVLWICWICRPGYQPAMASFYSSRLSAHVRFEHAYWPRPHLTHISHPRIVDPETGRQLASATQMTIHRRPDAVHITLHGPRLQCDALHRLWEMYDDSILKSKQGSQPSLYVHTSGLRITDPNADLELSDVAARVEQTATGPVTTLKFRPPHAPNTAVVEFELARWRNVRPPVTWFKVDTSSASLPCSCLPSSWGLAEWLGADAAFHGLFMGHQAKNVWNAHLVGRLSEVDLQRAGAKFQHCLSGKASIENLKLSVKEGRVHSVVGEVNSTGGSISAGFLNSLRRHITRQPALADSVGAEDKDVAFDWLSFRFVLEDSGRLTLHGLRDDAETLMADRQRVLLRAAASDAAVTDVDLIRAIFPVGNADSESVPISKEVLPLITSLPLPGFKTR